MWVCMGQVGLLDKHHPQPRPPPPHPSMSIHAKAEVDQQGAGVEVGCQVACRCLVTVAGVKQLK